MKKIIENTKKSKISLYFNIFTFKEKTRFLINSFQEDLKEYYYEINRTEFEEFFKFMRKSLKNRMIRN